MSYDTEWIKLNGGGANDCTTLIRRGDNSASISVNVGDDLQRELYTRSGTVVDIPYRGRVAIFNRSAEEAVKLTWLCAVCHAGIDTPHNKLDLTPDRFQSCRFCGNPSAIIAVDKWLSRYYGNGGEWRGTLVDRELADKLEGIANQQLGELLKVAQLVAIKRDLYGHLEEIRDERNRTR